MHNIPYTHALSNAYNNAYPGLQTEIFGFGLISSLSPKNATNNNINSEFIIVLFEFIYK